ncbi:accessory gene regulator B family protein [Ruminococcus flavefaciens]|uniref:Accessory gene regulator B n=1 Tax=Ruminococcus flavefaciens TaxID=1265 RepID=A0A315XTJ4_RUMFL|nr:accessory gene regulator B [Ruminococcus flavefaciens]SSA52159.1 accessory gene regulator B [Ruminococcus flavefaciens]
MFYKTSVYIADILEQQNKFAPEDKEVYRYGIQQGLNLTLNILTTIIIGVLCGMAYPSILFLVCYVPLRSFCGGYHAKTHFRCYIYSVIMITCILLVAKYTAFNIVLYEVLVLISLIIILLLAPVEDENKKLDIVEKRLFRKKAYIIAFLEVLLYHLFLFMHFANCYKIISTALFSLSILMIIGSIKNYIQRKRMNAACI